MTIYRKQVDSEVADTIWFDRCRNDRYFQYRGITTLHSLHPWYVL